MDLHVVTTASRVHSPVHLPTTSRSVRSLPGKNATLQSRIRELEVTVEKLRTGSDNEVTQEIRRLRYDPHIVIHIGREGMVEQGNRPFQGPAESQSESWASLNDSVDKITSPIAASDDSMSQSHPDLHDKGTLPTGEAVRAAIAALGDTTADMFFVTTAAESQRLLLQLYSQAKIEITRADVCLICAFCALGSQFIPNRIAEDSKKSLFKIAWMLVDHFFEVNTLQTLCAVLCLALFSSLEKRSSARLILASGM